MLDALYQEVEELFARARQAQPTALACQAGCHRCCHGNLTVFGIEAERVAAALRALPAPVRREAARRAEAEEHCALRDPASHRCLVYEARPLICRGFGLPTRFNGRVSWCPLNYVDERPAPGLLLDLDRLNRSLSELAESDPRWVLLADLAREGAPRAPRGKR